MKPAPAGKEIARQRPGYREGRPEIYTEGGAPADSADSIGAFYPANRKGYRDKSVHRPEVGAYAIQPIIK